MKLCVIIDLHEENYRRIENPDLLLNNLIIFLNSILKSSMTNQILCINHKKAFFNSNKDSLKTICTLMKTNISHNNCLENDIGYTLLIHRPDRMLIIDYKTAYNNIKLLKIAFSCQKLGIRVDCISEHKFLEQLCKSTGGLYASNGSIEYFFGLLGNHNQKMGFMEVKCICHDKMVKYGVVCPVCLSVYCKFVPICRKCRIKIEFTK